MKTIFKTVFYFGFLFSVFGCINKNHSDSVQKSPTVNQEVVPGDTIQEIVPENTIYEESNLDFFNPIGILGEGLINVLPYVEDNQEYVYIDKIMMYNDPECQNIFCSYDLNRTWYLPKGKNIIPLYDSIDYGWYCFVCTGFNADSYEIAINETERKYIKKDINIEYYTWEGFFDAVFTINPTEENPLREYPFENAEIIDIYAGEGEWDEPDDYHQKVELKDEWLHLKYEKSGIEGWLRWRKDNDIIVNISISW